MASKWQDAIAGGDGDIRRLKIEAPASGQTTKKRIRIIDNNFEDAWVHFFPGFKENGEKGTRFAVCHGKGKCPVCAKFEETGDNDFKAKRQFYMNVIDRKEEKPQIRLFQTGFGVFREIAALTDEESGLSDPSEFDVVISRTGAKMKDTKYAVKPFMKDGAVVKKPLPSDLKKLLDAKTEDGGPYDLSQFVQKVSIEEIEEMLTGEFSSKSKKKKDDDDDEDEKPRKKKYAADDDEDEDDEHKSKKKSKKSDDDDDDEDEDEKPRKKSDDDDEDEDEDEDEKPKKKGKRKDDDDEDEDDEDDEDEKPKKKGKSKKDDDDDEDEDEDEKPRKKKKSSDDDEDEDEEDDEDDEDEDEKPKKKSKKNKDDDDEDDD